MPALTVSTIRKKMAQPLSCACGAKFSLSQAHRDPFGSYCPVCGGPARGEKRHRTHYRNHHDGVHAKGDPTGDYARHETIRLAYLSHGSKDTVVAVTRDTRTGTFLLSVRTRTRRTATAPWLQGAFPDQPFRSRAAALRELAHEVRAWQRGGWKRGKKAS